MGNNCIICVHRGIGQEGVERCLLVNIPVSRITTAEANYCKMFERPKKKLYDKIKNMNPSEIASKLIIYDSKDWLGRRCYRTTLTGNKKFYQYGQAQDAAHEKLMEEV